MINSGLRNTDFAKEPKLASVEPHSRYSILFSLISSSVKWKHVLHCQNWDD